MFHVPERYRIVNGTLATDKKDGNNGAFCIPVKQISHKKMLFCIASDGMDWEHVSVSLKTICPTWAMMCQVKELFWDDTDLVVQFHPVKSEYVNNHPFCLHLWRKAGTNEFCERPPTLLVGVTS